MDFSLFRRALSIEPKEPRESVPTKTIGGLLAPTSPAALSSYQGDSLNQYIERQRAAFVPAMTSPGSYSYNEGGENITEPTYSVFDPVAVAKAYADERAKQAGLTQDQAMAREMFGYTPAIPQLAARLGYTGPLTVVVGPDTAGMSEAGYGSGSIDTLALHPDLVDRLRDYNFRQVEYGRHPGLEMLDKSGNVVDRFRVGDGGSALDKFMETAIPLALAGATGAAFGGLIPGAEIGAAGGAGGSAGAITGGGGLTAGGSAGYGTIGGTLGGAGGTTLGVAGGGISAGAGLTSPLLQSLGAVTAGSALPASLQPVGGLLDGLPAITVDPLPALESFAAANPVTAADLAATIPNISAPASAASSVFNAAKDSQAYNQAAGITGSQAASAATVPSTVNLSNAGGTMGTAGGLQGLLQTGGQVASDALGVVKDVTSPAWQFMKDNPALGRLLLGGATSLLSSQGGGSSGGSGASTVDPVKWNSPIQQGLLAPVQQYAPDAIQQRPSGLLAQGNAGDGAWRFLRGQ